MQEQNDIQFDAMPSLGEMFKSTQQKKEWVEEKIYDSLYDELLEKCDPDHFCDSNDFDRKRFEIANDLFAEILKSKNSPDNELRELRNRAIDQLGVRFSSKKKFDELNRFLNPVELKNKLGYDKDRMAEAGIWYQQLLQNKTDICALEKIEYDARNFISKMKSQQNAKEEELLKKEKEQSITNWDGFLVIWSIMGSLFLCALLCALLSSE